VTTFLLNKNRNFAREQLSTQPAKKSLAATWELDAMFAALLRKVCGSHRARFEAFAVALTKVGDFDGKAFEELKH
jgi:hypothetical protein